MIASIDGKATEETNGIGEYELENIMLPNNPLIRYSRGKYTKPIEEEIIFCSTKDEGLTQSEIANIQERFFNKDEFFKVEFLDSPDRADYYYMAKFINPRITYNNGKCYQFKITMVCNSPYCYDTTKSISVTYTEETENDIILNESHFDGNMFPNIEIVGTDSSFSAVEIRNNTLNEMIVIALSSYEIVTITSDLQITSNKKSLKLRDIYAGTFIRLTKGNNDISITGEFQSVTISMPVMVKGGA